MHSAAGADDLDELLDIVGDTVKVQTQASSLSGENGIFGPGIEMELVLGQEDVIGQADAARIEEQPLADAAHLLRVGVATRHDSWGVWTQQPLPLLQRNFDSGLEAADEGQIVGRELGEYPETYLTLLLCGWLSGIVLLGQEPGIGVAHDDGACQRMQPFDGFSGLRAALKGIAQADDLIDSMPLQISQGGIQGKTVAVNV
jgi:hypothetical protein